MNKSDSMDSPMLEIVMKMKDFCPGNILNLFHYTWKKYTDSILKDNCLDFRFSKATDFLDKNEGRSVFEPYYHACGRLYDSGKINEDFFNLSRGIKPEMIPATDRWVCCFSRNGNSGFMKERYSAKDGVIIGINYISAEEIPSMFPSKYGEFRIVKVSYSFSELRDELEKVLKTLYRYYSNCRANPDETKRQIVHCIVNTLDQYSLCYKDATYRKEEEIRFICTTKSCFSGWQSENQNIRLFFDEKRELHLILNKVTAFYNVSSELSWCNDSMLNKSILSSDEIKKCAGRYSSKNSGTNT